MMEAARLWALGNLTIHSQVAQDDDERNQALAAFGLRIEGTGNTPQREVFYLWPELEWVFGFFLDCYGLWRSGLRGYIGLDYAGVEALMRLRPVPQRKRKSLFCDIQIMEQAALMAWAERTRQRGG